MKFTYSWKLIIVGVVVFILAACQGSAEGSKEKASESPDKTEIANEEAKEGSKELEGSVVIDGSGTVYPLMARLAEEYMTNEQEGVSVEVSRAGTSAGFEKFLIENGTDFNNASREIKPEEIEKAKSIGTEVKELKVALDGLTFVINKENEWASEMTEEELTKIFLADGKITNWSDINPDWPNEKINTYGPNENHGTFEFFFENILEKQDLSDDINLQQEYATLVNLIADDKNGIAFFGFGYYVNNQDKLQAISVDFGDGPIEPSLGTINESGDYAPFTRPVFTYLNVNQAKENEQVRDYAIYVLNNTNEFAGETGFAPIPSDEVQENLEFLYHLK